MILNVRFPTRHMQAQFRSRHGLHDLAYIRTHLLKITYRETS